MSSSNNVKRSDLNRNLNDYYFLKTIGDGSFSTVYLAKDIHTKCNYAIKVCEKKKNMKKKTYEKLCRERDNLQIANNSNSDFFVNLYCTFQDTSRMFFVMAYAQNGDLLPYINKVFDEACAKFYSAEILCALEYLHDCNIMHRDLKPENILLDHNMHIKVADFGCSKIFDQSDTTINMSPTSDKNNDKQRRNSFVGTALYVSPEVLNDDAISPSLDLWAFGCIIYQMITHLPPFRNSSEYLLFHKISNLLYVFPDGFNTDAKDLVQKLLVIQPDDRLGAKDAKRYTSIRSHLFYQDMNFDTLHLMKPPLTSFQLSENMGDQGLQSNNSIPEDLEPGLDGKQLTRLLVLGDQSTSASTSMPVITTINSSDTF